MSTKKSSATKRAIVIIAAIAVIGVAISSAAPFKSELMGTLPEFEQVFTKLFVKSIDLASMDQIQQMYNYLRGTED